MFKTIDSTELTAVNGGEFANRTRADMLTGGIRDYAKTRGWDDAFVGTPSFSGEKGTADAQLRYGRNRLDVSCTSSQVIAGERSSPFMAPVSCTSK